MWCRTAEIQTLVADIRNTGKKASVFSIGLLVLFLIYSMAGQSSVKVCWVLWWDSQELMLMYYQIGYTEMYRLYVTLQYLYRDGDNLSQLVLKDLLHDTVSIDKK